MIAGHGTNAALNPEESLARRLALLSVSIGVLLAVSKIVVGIKAGSDSVLSDGFEATGDAFSSAIVFAGLWIASKPPDADHPYGHGRYETLSGLAVGTILLLAGAATIWRGFYSFGSPHSLAAYTLYPLFAAVVSKVALAFSKFHVGRSVSSSSLIADAWHDITDLLSTSVALIAVLLTILDPVRFADADHIGSLVIGIIILFLAARVVQSTVDQLVDRMPESKKMAEIRQSALSVEGALGIEKCFARRTGLKYHVDLHLEVDGEMTVRHSHEIATHVRWAIKRDVPWVADVLVHVEPLPASPAAARNSLRLESTHGK